MGAYEVWVVEELLGNAPDPWEETDGRDLLLVSDVDSGEGLQTELG